MTLGRWGWSSKDCIWSTLQPETHGPRELCLPGVSGQTNGVAWFHWRTPDFQLPSSANRTLRTKSLETFKNSPRGQSGKSWPSVHPHGMQSTEQQVSSHPLPPGQKGLPPAHCNLGKGRDTGVTTDYNTTKKVQQGTGEGHDKGIQTSGRGLVPVIDLGPGTFLLHHLYTCYCLWLKIMSLLLIFPDGHKAGLVTQQFLAHSGHYHKYLLNTHALILLNLLSMRRNG